MRGSKLPLRRVGTEGEAKVEFCCRARREASATEQTASPGFLAHPPGARLGIQTKSYKPMAWRPYENLMDGELDNRTPGKVTGWMRFFRNGKRPLRVVFDLDGDFHEDIRGALIRLRNPNPSDDGRDGSYVDGLARVQRGTAGDITAGLPLGPWTEERAQELLAQQELVWNEFGITGEEREKQRLVFTKRYRAHIEAGDPYYPYSAYPYLEWYSDNGRVVLELDPSQVEIVERTPQKPNTPAELLEDKKKRNAALSSFTANMAKSFSRKNRKKGGDGNVTGIVVG